MANEQQQSAFSGIKSYKVILPILIGFGVIVYMFWGELYPKPAFRGAENQVAVELMRGDTVLVRSGHLSFSSDTVLYVNATRIAQQVAPGDVLLHNGDSALCVLSVEPNRVQCAVLKNVSIKMEDRLSVPGVRLSVYNVVDVLKAVDMSWRFWCFIALAVIFMLGRDAGYVWRIRVLSDKQLTWMQSLRVIILWEFTSAITPSAIGGTSVAILYVHKEGVNLGKSSAMVMATSLLDEIYFVLMFPLLWLLIPDGLLFHISSSAVGQGLMVVTLVGYSIKLAWVLLLGYGLFLNPQGLRWLIVKVFSLPVLRRWREGAIKTGDEVVLSAKELQRKSFKFWFTSGLATFLSWTSRYWVVNALFMAFFAVHDHLLIFARQLVMWIMMLVSPTPGGSGFAEFVFKEFLGDFIPVAGLTAVIALLWRLITYYLYLIVGVVVVPGWIKSKFGKHK